MLQKTASWRFTNITARYDVRAKLPQETKPAYSVPPMVPFVR
jgi:hypothetical protein